ncbi:MULTISPECIES: hypothetical protein [Paraburkholderia]|uniref:Uncharacterized protein n=1 Tax=Paraburkholderia hospita TaxID=169430 RepID=A0AAN1JA87_9BURK|nr:hypothetical protein [Paraburkholderia hospita]AUT70213.1 hypothetical protein C2L64_09505 [Paraburkholderia hospita]SEI28035.1 hypothetical protein SAMN05192544_110444 [Paraburkholderia hospita]
MNTTEFIQQAERQAKIVEALLLARYTLVIHDSNIIRCEGEEWTLDFRPEIEVIDAALELAGIDTTQPMIAPARRRDDDSDGGDD